MTQYLIRDDGKMIVEANNYTLKLDNFKPYIVKEEKIETETEELVDKADEPAAKTRGRPAKIKE